MKRTHIIGLTGVIFFSLTTNADAFVHVVRPGETLAQVAARVYGDAKFETVLVGANGLDAQGGTAIVAGLRLEIPSPGHHRVIATETWPDLALQYLGDRERADLLARVVNGGVAWIPPTEGQEVEIPPILAHIANEDETITHVAERYWPDPTRAWEINNYNGRSGERLKRGEVVLVPLLQLRLTEKGKEEARAAAGEECAEGGGDALHVQRQAEVEIPKLLDETRKGEYAEAVARGNRLLGTGALAPVQIAKVQRALLEAFAAFDAQGPATSACAEWQKYDANAKLDPVWVSPKILKACGAL